jgi:aspartyl-tRNA(Asn)/glutamyl-tRNA(Gln) amidotransferase subunit C
MAIGREDVLHIARLARLALDDSEIERLTDQLNSILDHMEELEGVELAGEHAGERPLPALGAREIESDVLRLSIAEMAPSEREGFFLVPRLASHEGTHALDDPASDDPLGEVP